MKTERIKFKLSFFLVFIFAFMQVMPILALAHEAEVSPMKAAQAVPAAKAAALAEPVETTDASFTVSGGTITGLDPTWIASLMPDSEDGLVRISLKIPAQISGTTITAIRAGAFSTSGALASYPNLRITGLELSTATGLVNIGAAAFRNESGPLYSELSVAQFILPDSITYLGSQAFARQSGLKGPLVIPDSLTNIASYSIFENCTGFTSLDLNNVTSFQGSTGTVFSGCTGIASINLRNLQTFASSISNFQNCTALEGNLTIPAALTSLGGSVGNNQFYRCGTAGSGFKLIFPANPLFTEIPSQIFYHANMTGPLVIPEGITSIGSNAFSDTKISSVSFPSTITSIRQSFYGISSLAEINFSTSGGPLAISANAFRDHSASILVIPAYVTSIGPLAFASAGNVLKTVYLRGSAAGTSIGIANFPYDAVIIASQAEYNAWRAELGARVTYELEVGFYDPDTDAPIDGLAPMRKLFDKSIFYVKNNETGAWTRASSAGLPDIPADYDSAEGWSFEKNGSIVRDAASQAVLGGRLYPSEGVRYEFIWFGQYQQRPLNAEELSRLDELTEGVDYFTWEESEQHQETEYFKLEPIRWRIVEQEGNTYTLLAESLLDTAPFDASNIYVPWENSTIRQWLNGDFCNSAFSADEMQRVDSTQLSDVNTTDKVYLLSYSGEGFTFRSFPDSAAAMPDTSVHPGLNSNYANRKMTFLLYGGFSYFQYWWLRDSYGIYNLGVNPTASGLNGFSGTEVLGVRPMVTITLKENDVLSREGTYVDPYMLNEKKEMKVALGAHKILKGSELKAGAFTFTATLDKEASTEEGVATHLEAPNKADGTIDFEELTINKPGTYVYKITEDTGSIPRVTYDKTVYYVVITVVEIDTGELETVIQYYKGQPLGIALDGEPSFVNTYQESPPPAVPTGTTDSSSGDPDQEPPETAQTGDDSTGYGALLALAVIAIIAVLVPSVRRRFGGKM